MSIMRKGIDVTLDVLERAQENAKAQREKYDNFAETKCLLAEARASLQAIPAPWCDDCIWNTVEIIKMAEKELE